MSSGVLWCPVARGGRATLDLQQALQVTSVIDLLSLLAVTCVQRARDEVVFAGKPVNGQPSF